MPLHSLHLEAELAGPTRRPPQLRSNSLRPPKTNNRPMTNSPRGDRKAPRARFRILFRAQRTIKRFKMTTLLSNAGALASRLIWKGPSIEKRPCNSATPRLSIHRQREKHGWEPDWAAWKP